MSYESKKKKRKIWFDDSTIESQTIRKEDPIKHGGGGMAWPATWDLTACPVQFSSWEDVVLSFRNWKYGKVYGD